MSRNKNRAPRIGGVKVWVVLLIVALAVGLTCGIFKLTDNLSKGVTDLIYNQDNLVRTLEEYEGDAGNAGNGLTWTVYDNKSIRLEGKISSDEEKVEWVLGDITIEEDGTYTLSGVDGASLSTVYLQGSYTDEDGNAQTFYGDISTSCTVELTEGTVVNLKIVAYANVEYDKVIRPTLVLGDEAGKF